MCICAHIKLNPCADTLHHVLKIEQIYIKFSKCPHMANKNLNIFITDFSLDLNKIFE